jgi:hypothetical protein
LKSIGLSNSKYFGVISKVLKSDSLSEGSIWRRGYNTSWQNENPASILRVHRQANPTVPN